VIVNLVTPGWFETYGMMVRAGRTINERDTAGGEAVVVANQAFGQKFFPNGNAVGSVIYNSMASTGKPPAPLTIVGVVANAVDQSLRANAVPTVYQPLSQFSVPLPLVDMSLSVRAASGSPAMLARGVSAALTSVDRNLSLLSIRSMSRSARHGSESVWLRGFPASSEDWLSCLRESAYMASCRMPSRSNELKSASVWRSALSATMSSRSRSVTRSS